MLETLDIKIQKSKGEYECEFCDKAFTRPSSLTTHLCEKKRRWAQKDESAVVVAFDAYCKFYTMVQPSSPKKTYKDFIGSQYYRAFVKFGWYLQRLKPINTQRFIEFLIKNNKRLDHWCKDALYEEFMIPYVKAESAQDALTRAIQHTQEWAEESNVSFNNFFRYSGSFRITQAIANGRVSPWVVYNCDSGMEALKKLSDEELDMVGKILDPLYWKERFEVYSMDVDWATELLKEAGF